MSRSLLVFQDEFHVLIGRVEEVRAHCRADNEVNEIRCNIHLVNAPEEPWKRSVAARGATSQGRRGSLTQWNGRNNGGVAEEQSPGFRGHIAAEVLEEKIVITRGRSLVRHDSLDALNEQIWKESGANVAE